jgi:putative phosphoesterase
MLRPVLQRISPARPDGVPLASYAALKPATGAGRLSRREAVIRIVVLSDTHAPRRWKSCPPAVAQQLRGAGLILHAGDVCTAAVLDELAQYAPVTAVLGNNDGPDVAAWGAPETVQLTLEGVRVAMIHDSGAATGRLRRLRARFPEADLVVFGHSHIPLDDADADADHALRIFNPGSPTDRRRQPRGTLGVLQVTDGALVAAQIIEVS